MRDECLVRMRALKARRASRQGAIFGIIFFIVFTAISVPWVLPRGYSIMSTEE